MLEAVTSFSPSYMYSEPNPGIHTSHVVIQWNKPLLLLPLTILEVPVLVLVMGTGVRKYPGGTVLVSPKSQKKLFIIDHI